MLRTLVIAAAMLLPAGFAAAEDVPASPIGLQIVSDEGQVMGRVERVERNAQGDIVALDVSGLSAPEDAPYASSSLVSQADQAVLRAAFHPNGAAAHPARAIRTANGGRVVTR